MPDVKDKVNEYTALLERIDKLEKDNAALKENNDKLVKQNTEVIAFNKALLNRGNTNPVTTNGSSVSVSEKLQKFLDE